MPKIEKANVEDILALTPNQEGILFHYLQNREKDLYTIQMSITLRGVLDISLVKQAWDKVVRCNEMLRVVFSWTGLKQPVQIVLRHFTPDIEWYDCVHQRELLDEVREKDRLERFDLASACYRLKLCTLHHTEHVLLFSIHHIIYDGWSNGILWKEFFQAYHSLKEKGTVDLGVKTTYKQFIKKLLQLDTSRQREFWQQYVGDIDELPLLQQKKSSASAAQDGFPRVTVKLEEEVSQKLTAFLKKQNVSLSHLVYATWGLLLQFYCNSKSVSFGRVSSGRTIDLRGIQEMIGFFINIHPVRIEVAGDITAVEYLHNIKSNIVAMEEFEITPLSHILDYLHCRDKREPFNSIVVIENYPLDKEPFTYDNGLSVEGYVVHETNHYDLTLSVEAFDDIAFTIMYNEEKFDKSFIQGMVAHFHQLLATMLDGGDRKLADIGILTQNQQGEMIHVCNGTEVELPEDPRVLRWFEAQVEQAPERVALLWQEQALTYQALNVQVNRLAHALRAQGVGPNSFVGLLADRSPHLLIALLAILKAGGAYLPLDPQHPPERLATIVREAGLPLLLALPHLLDRLPDHTRAQLQVLDLSWLADLEAQGWPDSNPVPLNRPNDACYVLYTSGTTGTPKGVVIEQQALLNRLLWMQQALPIGPTDTLLHKTSIVFDVSVWELLWGLMQGARLHLLEPGAEKDPRQVLETVRRQQITVLHAVPSQLQQLVWTLEQFAVSAHASLGSLRYLIASGEALPPELVRRVYQLAGRASALHVVNLYGPTEATIDVSCYRCPRPAEEEGGEPAPGQASVPIGRPIANTQLYVVSPLGQMQPIGVAGQLCIGGTGLARGYLHRPELTAECFVCLPCCPGQRLYLTGDLARWRSDGLLEFLGRMDTQVKVRGFRIELREIEYHVKLFRGVRDVVTLVKQHIDGDMYIYAYVLSDDELDTNALKRHLMGILPFYMIPAFIIPLRSFPIQANGKVDRAELARMSGKEEVRDQAADLPRSRIESQIIEFWKEVLPTRNISIQDHYFDVGGNSLNLLKIYGRLQPLFPEKLDSITPLFRYPTVASLARYLTNDVETEAEAAGTNSRDTHLSSKGTTDIAIIGMAGRFPGAENIRQYWENVLGGTESIHFFSEEELIEAGVDPELIHNPNYVRALGILKDARRFDARFFGFSATEAELLDPQIRLFLECSWEVLEDAGYASHHSTEAIGMYAGASPNPFWEVMAFQSGKVQVLGDFAAEKLINKDHMASQISYRLNLTGPVFSLYTACSTSLVAVHLACQALLQHECSMAIAGGVSAVSYYGDHGYLYQEGMVFSPDGHCRAFDRDARGFVGGMGVGSILLKSLDKALEDRDHIYAVIKGTAINNDGNRKVGYTGLSIEAQAETIRSALQKAQVLPESIGYVETHGTGTELGDPLELKALELAFHSSDRNFCAVGSVKPCIGHLDCASGIASLIKTVLALKYAQIPPAVNFHVPSTKINFIDSPFYVNTEPEEWKRGKYPLRAGVNSLGLGGTNAHVILEEYIPEQQQKARNDDELSFIDHLGQKQRSLAYTVYRLQTIYRRKS